MVYSLIQKRILVTEIDFEDDFQMEVIRKLIAEDVIPLVFIQEFSHYDKLAEKYPRALPIFLDLNGPDGVLQGIQLISVLPPIAHIFNTNGENFNKSLSKSGLAYKYKVEEVNCTIGAKETMRKFLEANNVNLMLTMKAQNFSQISCGTAIREEFSSKFNVLRRSFRRTFSRRSSIHPSRNPNEPSRTLLPQPSSNPDLRNDQQTQYHENLIKTLQLENEKMVKVITKLTELSRTEYMEMEKCRAKRHSVKEKEMLAKIQLEMNQEKDHLLQLNNKANAQTMERFSNAETAKRIISSRATHVQRTVEQNAERKRRQETEKLVKEMNDHKKSLLGTHYNYMMEQQVKKFQDLQKMLNK